MTDFHRTTGPVTGNANWRGLGQGWRYKFTIDVVDVKSDQKWNFNPTPEQVEACCQEVGDKWGDWSDMLLVAFKTDPAVEDFPGLEKGRHTMCGIVKPLKYKFTADAPPRHNPEQTLYNDDEERYYYHGINHWGNQHHHLYVPMMKESRVKVALLTVTSLVKIKGSGPKETKEEKEFRA